jgi:ABC-type lipoprotein release transport system permease subunit
MDTTIVIALISLIGNLIGTLGGILVTSKLTNYRLSLLEEEVKKHNTLIDRMYNVETRVTVIEDELKGKK